MASEDTEILEFIQIKNLIYHQLLFLQIMKVLIEKIDGCKNNPENSFKTKVGENITSDFSMSTRPSFKTLENRHDIYR